MRMKPPETGDGFRLYHADIYLPEEIKKQCSGRYLRLRYTAHAQTNAITHSPALPILPHFTLLSKGIIEVITDPNGVIVSLATRIGLGRRWEKGRCHAGGDLFLSLDPLFQESAARVKATWLNATGSTHIVGRNYSHYERDPGIYRRPVFTPRPLLNPVFVGLPVGMGVAA